MKYRLLLLCFSFWAMGKAQQYYPLPTQYGLWYNQQLADFFQPQSIFYTYTLSGDTTFNGLSYKKLYNNGYIGALREDNKIVYYRPATAATESLLYNFNLTVNDTLFNTYTTHCALTDVDTLLVQSIDSIMCADGNYHKRFLMRNISIAGFGEYIIEGIGSMHGIVSPWYDVYYQNGGQRLNCAFSDVGPLYSLPSSECVTTLSEEPAGNIEMYPNPASGVCNISSAYSINHIAVYNLIGSRVYYAAVNSNKATVELYNAGMYIVEVNTGHKIFRRQLVVEK